MLFVLVGTSVSFGTVWYFFGSFGYLWELFIPFVSISTCWSFLGFFRYLGAWPPVDAMSCLWGGRRCHPSPPSTWMNHPLLLLLHHLPHDPLQLSAMMTVKMTCTAPPVESVLSSTMNILVVTAVVKMVWKSIFIVQCAVVAEAWKMKIANWRASCHLQLIIQQAYPTCDVSLLVVILCSIIQCSMTCTYIMSLKIVIKIWPKKCHLPQLQILPPGGATCIRSKFDHHVHQLQILPPLASVANFTTKLRHLHQLQNWPQGGATYTSCKFGCQLMPQCINSKWSHQVEPYALDIQFRVGP